MKVISLFLMLIFSASISSNPDYKIKGIDVGQTFDSKKPEFSGFVCQKRDISIFDETCIILSVESEQYSTFAGKPVASVGLRLQKGVVLAVILTMQGDHRSFLKVALEKNYGKGAPSNNTSASLRWTSDKDQLSLGTGSNGNTVVFLWDNSAFKKVNDAYAKKVSKDI